MWFAREPIGLHAQESRSSASHMKRDEADVQKLSVYTSELMRNPFTLPNYDDDECLPLVNMATGVVMHRELSAKLL